MGWGWPRDRSARSTPLADLEWWWTIMAVAGGGGQTCHVILLPLSRACHMNIIFYFMLETIKRTASFIHVPVANIIFHTNLKLIYPG